MTDHLPYAAAWLLFGVTHSGLAGRRLCGRWSRLVYNGIAIAQFALIAWVGAVTLGPLPAFDLPRPLVMVMGFVHVSGWLVLLYAARFYDLGRLAGTTQARAPDQAPDEGLRTDGPHAYVRHPLYAGGYLILWGAALSPLGLATALWGSAYLAIGTWFEERKLLRLYGSAYADYRRRVPALIPWRGRVVD